MEGILNRKVRNFITANHLLGAEDRILVGLSGGADSVCLLLILSELGYDCLAAHCNFHLRGEESMRDEDFCRELCERVGVEFRKKDFDVEGCCRDHKESVEMACRRLRYDWWDDTIWLSEYENGHNKISFAQYTKSVAGNFMANTENSEVYETLVNGEAGFLLIHHSQYADDTATLTWIHDGYLFKIIADTQIDLSSLAELIVPEDVPEEYIF